MQSKDLRSERHIINLLTLLISLDRFYAPLPFTSINSREQILKFLNHQYLQKDGKGKWVEREHDADGNHRSWSDRKKNANDTTHGHVALNTRLIFQID